CAGELGERLGVEEAKTRAVDGNIAVAGMDVVEDIFFRLGVDALDVGVNEKGVEAIEIFGGEVLQTIGVGEVDAAAGEGGVDVAEAHEGDVVAVVAEEEDFESWLRERGTVGGAGG